ncbi:hypothetical protein M9H77_22459 [Catharanthus roseus]|uniref:Uncharacterized protein n=1 Tax=Catharanthus roseus TaxID=4058 RepID=A0ACC0AUK1_CATRO|nr:hypothetical protein M9H77_22459 [Catharanthus roseus]
MEEASQGGEQILILVVNNLRPINQILINTTPSTVQTGVKPVDLDPNGGDRARRWTVKILFDKLLSHGMTSSTLLATAYLVEVEDRDEVAYFTVINKDPEQELKKDLLGRSSSGPLPIEIQLSNLSLDRCIVKGGPEMENHDENESFLAEIEEKITMTRKRFIHIKRKARRVGRQSFETPLEKIHILEIVKDDRILFCTRRRQARGLNQPSIVRALRALLSSHHLIGHEYTWNNRRAGNSNIQERLDRWIDNGEWQILFPQATVNPHTVSQSNYRPIILNTYLNQYNVPKSLRLENSGRAMKEPERALKKDDIDRLHKADSSWTTFGMRLGRNLKALKQSRGRKKDFLALKFLEPAQQSPTLCTSTTSLFIVGRQEEA